MPALKHIHSYIRWRIQKSDGHQLWKCADPECTHFHRQDAIIDKASLCPECKTHTLMLDYEALRRHRPLCIRCRGTREGREFRESLEKVTELFKEG